MSDNNLINRLFDQTLPGLEKTLDLRWRRNQALTSNIANAETPQYRAVDLNFAGELDKAFHAGDSSLKRTNEKHLDLASNSQSHLVGDYSGATKADGNNVDLDIQMGKLSLNAGKYSIATSLVRKKLQMMRQAIRFAMR